MTLNEHLTSSEVTVLSADLPTITWDYWLMIYSVTNINLLIARSSTLNALEDAFKVTVLSVRQATWVPLLLDHEYRSSCSPGV